MDTCLQDAASVLENERCTLEWVRNKTAKIRNLNDLFQSAEQAYYRFDASQGMRVCLKWPVLHEVGNGNVLWIHIGGLIELDNSTIENVTYYLCISREEQGSGKNRVLRKFHFDYANSAIRESRRSSVFHLQYAGELPPELKNEHDYDHLDPWFEEPRVFFLPMSLSLVLHMAFREFPDEDTDKLCEDGYWRSRLVKRDEKYLIVPFLKECLSVGEDKKKLLWDSACDPSPNS